MAGSKQKGTWHLGKEQGTVCWAPGLSLHLPGRLDTIPGSNSELPQALGEMLKVTQLKLEIAARGDCPFLLFLYLYQQFFNSSSTWRVFIDVINFFWGENSSVSVIFFSKVLVVLRESWPFL